MESWPVGPKELVGGVKGWKLQSDTLTLGPFLQDRDALNEAFESDSKLNGKLVTWVNQDFAFRKDTLRC